MKTFNKFFVTFLLINQSLTEVCQNDEECAENLTCFNQNCTNLCSPYQCATNAECLTINHQINCKCKEGFSGDGWIECINFFVDGKIDTDQFCNWNDKINSECRQISIFYIIDGVINSENYIIDPKFKDLTVEGFEIASEKINPNLNLLPKVDEIFLI
ncbi:hypothetical protein PVAND_014946 [Polypedilum vanderplanki]|uniref:EGF-like domain-containing protein n=1 Tax=Polypedilum vanderplanki TaxID=319348 RepID=A0A9J6BB68_POLVA|nr:hypothetical protein PVAND_014946 [Polypedilum vanderplanki]